MNRDDIILIKKYVNDLLSEFEVEEDKLRIEHEDMSARIMEINENIHNYHENEDVNLQVFSPRKVDNKNEARLDSLNSEKESIESDIRLLLKQSKYYTDKTDKLRRILELIDIEETSENMDSDYMESDDEIQVESTKKSQSKFSSLMDELSSTDDNDNTIDITDNEQLKEDLSRVSHKIDFCVKIIDNDVFRTKMELKTIKDSVTEIIEEL